MYAFIYTGKCYMFYIVVNFTVLSPKQCINEVNALNIVKKRNIIVNCYKNYTGMASLLLSPDLVV